MGIVLVSVSKCLLAVLMIVVSLNVSSGFDVDSLFKRMSFFEKTLVTSPPSRSPSPAPRSQRPSPSPSPSQTPSRPSPAPKHTPTPGPAPSPRQLPTRDLVAVQGVVYCKSCKYKGIPTLLGASPLSGAVVRLQCNNTIKPWSEQATTDKNGYFLLQASKRITSYGSHKCNAFLVSSPLPTCNKTTDLHGGQSGASLRYQASPKPTPFALFTVGPFAFEPASCPR